jgi:hypothetical protein
LPFTGARPERMLILMVDVADDELIKLLTDRDGPIPDRSWSHADEGECRYSEMYDGEPCPWCEALARRLEREAEAQA